MPSLEVAPKKGSGRPCAAVVSLAMLLAAAPLPAEIYRWVDEAGRVHYGDAKPADQDARTVAPPPPPSRQEVQRAEQRLSGMLRSSRPPADSKPKTPRPDPDCKRQAACEAHRHHLKVLELKRPVYHLDENGERVYLEDDQRASEIAETRELIKHYCR